MARLVAPGWAERSAPPLGPDKARLYAAALRSGDGGGGRAGGDDARARLARCLVWCEAEAGQYCPTRLSFYRVAFLSNPDDERAAFFAAALCRAGLLTEPGLAPRAYVSILRPEWRRSAWWTRFLLSPHDLTLDLARRYAVDAEVGAPNALSLQRIAVVESALEQLTEKGADRDAFAAFLARAYRARGRTDEVAEVLYRFVFNRTPDDQDNTAFLARLYANAGREDATACAAYTRAAAHAADADGDSDAARTWSLRAARASIAMGRLTAASLPVLEQAAALAPNDLEMQAAYWCALACRITDEAARIGGVSDARRSAAVLEEASSREAEAAPVLAARGWDGEGVARGLALVWAVLGRTDQTALNAYARAAVTLDRTHHGAWLLLARVCATAGEDGSDALSIYEGVVAGGDPLRLDGMLLAALGRAYVRAGAWEGEPRLRALTVWEALHRMGQADAAMMSALARAYAGEERVGESALTLWAQAVQAEPKNGELRLRLAQEWRLRGEYDTALGYYKEAAKLLPRSFTAQYEMGALLKERYSDYTAAARLLQKAVKLPGGQKHLAAQFALGEVLLARDKREEAKAVFQKIVDEIDAQHAPTLIHLAKLNLRYEEEGSQRARALYEQAAQADPDHPETYRKMAELFHERGQTADEEQALERYLSLSEPDPERYRHLADLYLRRGDYGRAENALRQVIALGQGDKRLYTLLGEVIVQGRANAAV
jgi:tetratricopeptide (TPR) repeat protein